MKAEHYPRAERETENNPDGFRWRIQTHCAGRQAITETVVCVMDLARMRPFEAVHGTGLPAAAVLGLIDAARTVERLVKAYENLTKERDDLAAELNRIKDGNSGLLDRALNAEKKLTQMEAEKKHLATRLIRSTSNESRPSCSVECDSLKKLRDDATLPLHVRREAAVAFQTFQWFFGEDSSVLPSSVCVKERLRYFSEEGEGIRVEEAKPVVIDFEKKLTPVNQEAPEPAASLLARLGDNAQKWAQEFISTLHRIGWSELDEALMTSWFANAIEHSSDVRRFASALAQTPGLPETEVQIGPNGTTLKFHGIPTAGQIKELEDLGLLEKELPAS